LPNATASSNNDLTFLQVDGAPGVGLEPTTYGLTVLRGSSMVVHRCPDVQVMALRHSTSVR
jgi:hypothetical protein